MKGSYLRNYLLFCILIFLFSQTTLLTAMQFDYYDLFGSHFMYAERLFYIEEMNRRQDNQPSGYSLIGFYDKRWIEDFKSHVVVYETYDNIKNMMEIGRTPTRFTELTLDKTLWGPSYLYRQQQGFKFESQIPWYLNRFTFLFTRTDFKYNTTTDWRWEENIGEDNNGTDIDSYFIGSRFNFAIARNLDLGLSYVNQHSSFQGINSKVYTDPFAGSTRNSMYKGISIRFADASPDDGIAGAAIYSIKVFINGKEKPELGFNNNIPGAGTSIYWPYPVQQHQEANGEHVIDFWFDLTGYSDIEKVEFYFDVANDYLISFRTDNNLNGVVSDDTYITIFNAGKNIKNYQNRRTLHWQYGEYTGRSIYGVNLNTKVFDINISLEYALLASYKRMPGNTAAEYPIEYANACFIKLLKDFHSWEVGLEAFNMDWDYNADFAVEDNDDNDVYPDITDDPDLFDGGDGINFKTIDKNNNGIKDYDEDFLLFDNDIYEFREGEDNNNNDIFDNEENDNKPDYPYDSGTRGITGFFSVTPVKPFNIISKNIFIQKEIDDQMSQKNYLDLIYNHRLFAVNEIYIKNRTAYIKDTIPDDTIDQEGQVIKDELDYMDNINNSILLKLSHDLIRKLSLINAFYNKYDISHFSKDNSFDDKLKRYTYATMHKIRYTITPVRRFDIIPLFKISWLYKYSSSAAVYENYYWDKQKAAGLEFVYQWTRQTKLMWGYQKLFLKEYENIITDEVRDTYAVEFVHITKYWDRDFGIIAGFIYAKHDYLQSILNEDYEYEKFYIHSYFNW